MGTDKGKPGELTPDGYISRKRRKFITDKFGT